MTIETPKPPIATVIQLRPPRPDAPRLRRGRSKTSTCSHRGTLVVDEHARTFECDACGADMDPIWFLLQIANDGDWVIAMRKERRELEAEVLDLRKERNTLRAAVKRGKATR